MIETAEQNSLNYSIISYKNTHNLDPNRYMFVARVDFELIDSLKTPKKNIVKGANFVINHYNKLGSYVVIYPGRYWEPQYIN